MSAAEAIPIENTPAQNMSRRVARNSIWLIGQPLALNVVSILSNAYIARKLGATDYGAFNLGFAQVAIFTQLCYLGLRQVAIRAVAEDRDRASHIARATLTLRLLLAAAAALLALGWLALPTYSVTTRLIGAAAVVSMIATALGTVAVDVFVGLERPKVGAQCQLVGGLLLTVLSVAVLALGGGLPWFVGAYVAGALFQAALLLWMVRRHGVGLRPVWDSAVMRDLFHQARPFAVMSLIKNVSEGQAIDVLILGAFAGTAQVGPYAAVMALVTRALAVPEGIVDAIYPAVANRYRSDRAEVERTAWRYVLNVAMLTVPVALCLSVTAPTVLWLLFGGEYTSSAGVLRVAAWLIPLWGINHLMRYCLSAARQQDLVLRLSLVSAASLAVLFAVLIPRYGAMGAAMGGVARELIMMPFWMRSFAAHFRIRLAAGQVGRLVLASGAMLVPLVPVVLGYTHLGAILGGGASLAFYGGATVALGLVSPSTLPLPGLRR